jgi:hypothetical protein
MSMREVGIEGRFEEEEEDKDDDGEYLIMSVCARLGRASLRIHDGVYSVPPPQASQRDHHQDRNVYCSLSCGNSNSNPS